MTVSFKTDRSRARALALLATASTVAMLVCAGSAGATTTINGVTDTTPGTFASPFNIDDGLFIGTTAVGEFDVNSAAQVTVTHCFYAVMGQNVGGSGTLKIDGAGTNFDNGACGALVGEAGNGTLAISNGGAFTTNTGGLAFNDVGENSGTTGTVTIAGAGSTWNYTELVLGDQGTGTLTVSNGGTLNEAGCAPVDLGNNTTGNGTVTVTGAGSQWADACAGPGNLLYVGASGTGAINATAGGVVHGGQTVLGEFGGAVGSLTVNGAGSKFLSANQMTVGEGGTGTLLIQAGGLVTDTGAIVGGVNSSVTVDGAGSTWTQSGIASISSGATTTITISNGGTITSTTAGIGGALTIKDANSNWTLTGNMNVGALTPATLSLSAGGLLSDATGTGGASSNTIAHVTIDGVGTSWTNSSTTDFGGGFKSVFTLDISNGGALTDTTSSLETGTLGVHDAGSNWTSTGNVSAGTEGLGVISLYDSGTMSVAAGAGTLTLGGIGFGNGQLYIGGNLGAAQDPGTLLAATVFLRTATSEVFFHDVSAGYTFAPAITGIGGVDNQAGVNILTGASTYTGATSVDLGTLLVNGSLAATTVTVLNGALGGSGSIGGPVTIQAGAALLGVGGQVLTTGAMTLDSASNVDVSLGAPSTTRLFAVNGALTLDGALNVTDAGGFGPGLYRLFDYTGALTDNTLDIGAVPVGVTASNLAVQTSVAGQVNLIYTLAGVNQFWNGSTLAPTNTINGGAGTWKVGPTNWTDLAGSASGPWTSIFGIFMGAPGAVTIDNSGGAVDATGLQFAVDGYTVGGGTLTLTGATAVVRVGDATLAGAGYTATISAPIAGVSALSKTDLGTLVLSGANTYSGGTQISAGALSVSSDGNLGASSGGVAFAGVGAATATLDVTGTFSSNRTYSDQGNGVFNVGLGDDLTLTGALTGASALSKTGAGTLTLSSADSYSGALGVSAGTLQVNGGLNGGGAVNVLVGAGLGGSGSIVGAVNIASGGVLLGVAGQTLTVGSLAIGANANVDVSLGAPSSTGLFNVTGNLTLAGNLNIADAGGFGPGLYRLIDYTGALTDNGMVVGVTPSGVFASDLTVQTSVANQVNLIFAMSGPAPFWNGSTTTPTGTVVGGDGTWKLGPTNWSDAAGATSGAWAGGGAIFMGAPGTVTIDNSGGAVTASGLQFAVDGYSIGGDVLTLTGAAPTIRVGDGTSAGGNDTATIASVIAGSGGLTKTDLGALVLSGVNTYTGGTTIAGGRLSVGADANLGDVSGGLTFNGGSLVATSSFTSNRAVDFAGPGAVNDGAGVTLILAGPLSGSGDLDKVGAGTLELTGAGSYSGLASVDAGDLRVDGSIGGALLVQSGARVQGRGSVGNLSVLTGGTVAPGDSIGTLTVNGGLTLQTGSTYEVQLNAQGQSDLIHVTGAATLQGGTVSVLGASGVYSLGTQYAILTADGGRTGAFASLTSQGLGQPFLQFSLAYDPAHVYVDVTRSAVSFCSVAKTANQCAAGTGADSLGAGNVVNDTIANLPDVGSAGAAFDALSGEIHASDRGIALEDSRFVREAAFGRLRQTGDGHALWGQVFGAQGSVSADGNAAGLDRSLAGFFMGADTPADRSWRLGVLGGYSQTRFSINARSSSGSSNDYHLGAYAGASGGPLKARVGAAYTLHDITTNRGVAFDGFADFDRASPHSHIAQVFGELAWPLDRLDAAAVEPFADVAYVALHTDGFTETGGAAALKGAASDAQATFATVGVRAEARWTVATSDVSLKGSVGWRGAFGDVTPQQRLAFASGGSAFTIDGAPISKDAAIAEVDLGVKVARRTRVSLSYSGQAGAGASDQSLKLGVNVGF